MDIQSSRKNLHEELPSILLLTLCYAGFAVLTVFADQLGLWLAVLALVPILVLHSSLQHEFIHGHPTTSTFLNDLLVSPALSLFVPYLRFKDTHLAHHFDPNLTDPYDDPESNFLDPAVWDRMPRWKQSVCGFNNTLFGRMLIGPILGLLCFYRCDAVQLAKRNKRVVLSYAHHALGLFVVFVWIHHFSSLPFWGLLLATYLSMSILKIRTFLEHAAHERVAARTVVIEDRGPLALLFLNNNFHATHHCYPKLVWHRLPAKFYERREESLRRNGGYWFGSYRKVFWQFLFRRKDPVAHPLMSHFESGLYQQAAEDGIQLGYEHPVDAVN